MSATILTEADRLHAFDEADRAFQMNEESFRRFYDQTARQVWMYLARSSGDDRVADDLLQETYYRFLRVKTTFESDDHRRHYLFRIAMNLIRDHRRLPRSESIDDARHQLTGDTAVADRVARQIDLGRAMERLKPRERSLLWLAYAQGWSHAEIAASLGIKAASLKVMLFRARRRLLRLLVPMDGRK
jgi:RNA polymerase sigma-70 factor (ECF subfamily)